MIGCGCVGPIYRCALFFIESRAIMKTRHQILQLILILCVSQTAIGAPSKLALEPVAAGYEKPVQIVSAPGETGTLYVVEHTGKVRTLNAESSARRTVLDLSEAVVLTAESGLLGFAFHPSYQTNRLAYAHYIGKARTNENRISEYTIPAGGSGDPEGERRLIRLMQKTLTNLGGQIAFGPDNFLYIGLGDGSGENDPQDTGQNANDALASILRIDVQEEASTKQSYLAPVDNPFVVSSLGSRDVWAYGLRNPRTLSFDPLTKNLWSGDAGPGIEQEINLIQKGGNYGWSVFDGVGCLRMKFECMNQKYRSPAASYVKKDGTAVTVGFVQHGSALGAEFDGALFFADQASGNIWALKKAGEPGAAKELVIASGKQISAFGLSEAGEILVADYATGDILKITAPLPDLEPPAESPIDDKPAEKSPAKAPRRADATK